MKTGTTFVILFFLALSGCSEKKSRPGGEIRPARLSGVAVETVQPSAVEDFFEAVGTVRSRKTTSLSSKSVGAVLSISVKEGDKVKKGQTLAEIDNRDIRADLNGAEAASREVEWALKAGESGVMAAKGQRDLAAATFKRYEPLVSKGSVTPHEFDEVSAKYKVASAELNQAEENLRALKAKKEQAQARIASIQSLLSYTRVTAPFDGVVTAKTAEVGTLASPGTPILTVEEAGRYRLEAQVGEAWISYCRVGNIVPVIIDAIQGELSGTVAEIVPAADPQSRTFTVKIELPSEPGIRSGLYGKAEFSLGKKRVLLVPATAVLQKGQLVGLYAVEGGGVVRFRLVQAGKRRGDRIEILSGLNPGERVVTKGVEKVSDGKRIGN